MFQHALTGLPDIEVQPLLHARLLGWAGAWHSSLGRHHKGIQLLEQSVRQLRDLRGASDLNTLASQHHLAVAYGRARPQRFPAGSQGGDLAAPLARGVLGLFGGSGRCVSHDNICPPETTTCKGHQGVLACKNLFVKGLFAFLFCPSHRAQGGVFALWETGSPRAENKIFQRTFKHPRQPEAPSKTITSNLRACPWSSSWRECCRATQRDGLGCQRLDEPAKRTPVTPRGSP